MPSAQKPAGAEGAERALSRDQPAAAEAAVPTPANKGSASAAGAEVISKEHQQNPPGNDDLLVALALVQGPSGPQRSRHTGATGQGWFWEALRGLVCRALAP